MDTTSGRKSTKLRGAEMSDCSVYVAQIQHYRSLLVLLSDALATKGYLSVADEKLIAQVDRLQQEWTPPDPGPPDACDRLHFEDIPVSELL